VKLKRKINLKKIKRIKIKFEKITYHKLGWNNEIEILQKLQEKKL
jgi:hypothetical protein